MTEPDEAGEVFLETDGVRIDGKVRRRPDGTFEEVSWDEVIPEIIGEGETMHLRVETGHPALRGGG